MFLRVEGPRTRNFDDVAAPQPFGAKQLNEGPLAPGAFPRLQWKILHPAYADIAINRNILRLHEVIVWRVRPDKFTVAGARLFISRFFEILLSRMIHECLLTLVSIWNLQSKISKN